jgi:hypothetical protein
MLIELLVTKTLRRCLRFRLVDPGLLLPESEDVRLTEEPLI